MAAVANVAINVDSRDASRKLRDISNRSKEVSKAAGTASYNVQRFGVALRSTVAPLVALTGAATFLSRSLTLLGSRQADAAALANGLEKLGKGSATLERLQRSADKLGKATLFDQEDFDAGFKLLTSFRRIGVDSYERVAQAAADVAQVTGQDVQSALMQLSKALEDPAKRVTDLARSGTVFTDQQKAQIKALQESGRLIEAQNLILKEIEAQYGGAAEAAGSAGYAGAVDSLGESFRDFQATIANVAEPAVVALLGSFTQLFNSISNIPEPAGRMALEIGAVTAAVVLLTKAVNTFMASKLAAFLGTQIALFKAFGAQIYLTAAAQGALNGVLVTGQALMAALPVAAVTLAVVGLADALRQAATDQGDFNRLLSEGTVEQLKNALATEKATLALAEKMELQGRGAGRAADKSRIERSKGKIQQLEQALAEGMLGGGVLPQDQPTSELPKPPKLKKLGRTGPDPAKELEQRLKALQRIQTAAQRENELRQQTSDLDSDLLQISYRYRDLQNEIAEIVGTSQDAQVLKLQKELETLLGINEEEEKRIRTIEERRKEFKKMSDQQKPIEDKLTTFIKSAQDRLADLQQVAINISQGIGNAVANSLTNGIQGLIDGSQKVKDVFANLLQSVGQILAQEGAKMIATYIAIGIAKIFAGLGGGGYGSGAEKPLTSGMDYSSAFSSGGFGIAPRANGGPVNRNSAYMVGENGPELFVPGQAGRIESNSDMRSMMSRQRSNAPAMNFTFETTSIGGQEFVSREQLEAAMAVTRRQAASDGARRGMNMTLDKMQQSPATRRRVGIS